MTCWITHPTKTICQQNCHYANELEKRYHNSYSKTKSYTLGDKIWLNIKYIKTKQNCKLKAKLFGLFWILHLVKKQVYKLEQPKRQTIDRVFYESLLEQNGTKKRLMNKTTSQLEFESNNKGKKYNMKAICESVIYYQISKNRHLPGLYYFMSWKDFPEKEKT